MSDRKRIVVVVDRIADYQVPLIRGVKSAVQSAGGALLIVVSHPHQPRQDTTVRRLVAADLIDGVVITPMRDISTKTSRSAQAAELAAGVPVATISVRLPGVPAVLPENVGGLRAAMAHLIDDCGRRRPLLLAGTAGNTAATEREAGYREMATERALDLPPDPVLRADFEREPAYRRVIERLDAGRDFDAIVACNDEMAFGALDALNERGVRVPEDVALVGFDNVAEAYLASPPLTTVDVELHEQGRTAAVLVLDQLAGGEVPHRVMPSSRLIVRGSSAPAGGITGVEGTPTVLDTGRATTPESAGTTPESAGAPESAAAAARVLAALDAVQRPVDPEFHGQLQRFGKEWIPMMIDGAIDGTRGVELGAELVQLVVAHPEPLWWGDLTATARAALTTASPDGTLTPTAEAGLLRVTLYVERALAQVRQHRDREVLALSEHVLKLNRALLLCDSLEELTRELSAYLPRLNISRCFLVLLDTSVSVAPVAGEAGAARLVMSYRNGRCDPAPDPMSFRIDRLLPASLGGELEHGSLTVQALFTDSRWFGVMLHEQTTMDRHTSEALRLETSRVLQTMAEARAAAERAIELEALVSMRTEQLELEVASRRAAQESLHAANLELRRALLLDGLTGLQNRPSFDEHLKSAWHQHLRSGEPLSVLMIDVDHFKRFNDTYGHLAGDTCLRQVAACLASAVSRKQDIVARFGGEEFAVVLPDTDVKGARRVAERLLRSLRAAAIPHIGSDHGQVSVSIGVGGTGPEGVKSLSDLLELADRALYVAKRNGRDRVEDPVG